MPESAIASVFVPASMAVLMVGVGSTLSVDDFKRELRAPRALVTGLVGQLVALPLLCFAIVAALQPPPPLAIGLVLLAACPGGVFSNLMAHLAKGRTALSVVLTATSTAVGMITIPLWVGVAMAWLTTETVAFDLWANLPKIAAMTTVPVLIGVWLRHIAPRTCRRLERPFGLLSAVFLVAVAALIGVGRGAEIGAALAAIGPAAVVLSLGSSALGAGLAALARLDSAGLVTVAMEVGIQNAGLAAALAISAFPEAIAADVALPALLYLLVTFLPAAAWIALGRWFAAPHPDADG